MTPHKQRMLPKGKPLRVVQLTHDGPKVNKDALSAILLDSRVRDNKVMVVSVIGIVGTGKSSLLNSFLRFLSNASDEHWADSLSLKEPPGFFWGENNVTTGIYFWSEPFVTTLPSGEQIAILLMDTQGLFGNDWNRFPRETSLSEPCSTNSSEGETSENISFDVFGLAALLSSVLVYNVESDIRSYFHDLKTFAEYARMPLKNCNGRPFQNLHFLVRDWYGPGMFPFGDEGGMQLLESRKSEVNERRPIPTFDSAENFEDVKCFLMPKMTRNEAGDVARTRTDEFARNLKTFTESLFDEKNLKIKKINGKEANGNELMEYFELYAKDLQKHSLRNLFSKHLIHKVLQAPVNFKRVVTFYSWEMEKRIRFGDIMNNLQLQEEHDLCCAETLRLFRDSLLPGHESTFGKDKSLLKRMLNDLLNDYSNRIEQFTVKKADVTVEACHDFYREKMKERNGESRSPVHPILLERDHSQLLWKAVNMFRSSGNVVCGETEKMEKEMLLEEKIYKSYEEYKVLNQAKTIRYNYYHKFRISIESLDSLPITMFMGPDDESSFRRRERLKLD